ncbi:carbamoyl-phosphate synthetase large chain, oligomerization domain protein [Mycobacterium kansasii]|uniref:Carbamoyl-phosphate synthetase large chain, oligomerization domain protein n=1 Tax=Mycobacterium kansasii TaxID=1768 RepID=A0A1V3WDX8_MYCKA|nr:carbamoyl-phosphate synthetase large chain, oligomerization domain protein [Mycobacterium kansasii]
MLTRLQTPTEGRLYDLELALRLGASVEQAAEASGVDPWFVAQIGELVKLRAELVDAPVLDAELLRHAKHSGLSDRQIASLRPELAGRPGSDHCASDWASTRCTRQWTPARPSSRPRRPTTTAATSWTRAPRARWRRRPKDPKY